MITSDEDTGNVTPAEPNAAVGKDTAFGEAKKAQALEKKVLA
jgi:hypothetical protein